MKIENLESYAEQKGYVSVPMIQKTFGLNYRNARAAMSHLEKQGLVVYDSGLMYRYVFVGMTEDEIAARRILREKRSRYNL